MACAIFVLLNHRGTLLLLLLVDMASATASIGGMLLARHNSRRTSHCPPIEEHLGLHDSVLHEVIRIQPLARTITHSTVTTRSLTWGFKPAMKR